MGLFVIINYIGLFIQTYSKFYTRVVTCINTKCELVFILNSRQ